MKTYIRNIERGLQVFGEGIEFVLVNYNSTDGLHEWVQQNLSSYIDRKIVSYHIFKDDNPYYYIAHADNMAMRLAQGQFVSNLMADCHVRYEYFQEIKAKMAKGILVFSPYPAVKTTTGLLTFAAEDFQALGGYDEDFLGWGSQDIDIYYRMGLSGRRVRRWTATNATPELHDDSWRTVHSPINRNKDFGNEANMGLMVRRVQKIQRYGEAFAVANQKINWGSTVPRKRHTGKMAVYTCITAQYDSVRIPEFKSDRPVDFIVFSDQPTPFQRQAVQLENPILQARYHKILSHIVLPEYDYWLWIDGNQRLVYDPWEMVDLYLKDQDFSVFEHPYHNNEMEEMQACIEKGKADPSTMSLQLQRYRDQGYEFNNGLFGTCTLLRRNTEVVQQLNNMWWSELYQGSTRDQLSLPYVLRQLNIHVRCLPGHGELSSFCEFYQHQQTETECPITSLNFGHRFL